MVPSRFVSRISATVKARGSPVGLPRESGSASKWRGNVAKKTATFYRPLACRLRENVLHVLDRAHVLNIRVNLFLSELNLLCWQNLKYWQVGRVEEPPGRAIMFPHRHREDDSSPKAQTFSITNHNVRNKNSLCVCVLFSLYLRLLKGHVSDMKGFRSPRSAGRSSFSSGTETRVHTYSLLRYCLICCIVTNRNVLSWTSENTL